MDQNTNNRMTEADRLLQEAGRLGREASLQTGVAFNPSVQQNQSAQQAAPINISKDVSTTVSPGTIGTSPINLPEQPISTIASAITGKSPAIIEQQKTREKIDQDNADKEAELNQKQNAVSSLMDSISGKQQERAKAEGDVNTPGSPAFLKETARKASNSLDVSQRAQMNELKALFEGRGLGMVQIQQAQQEINRRYGFEQADLQLTAHLANSDYNAAEETLNKKLELELEPLKTKLAFQTAVYNDVRAQLTKSEDRKFDQLIANTNRALETETANRKEVNSTILKASQEGVQIPANILTKASNAKDIGELNSILQGAGITLQNPKDAELRQAQINSANRANSGNTGPTAKYANDLDAITGAVLSTIPSRFGQDTFNKQVLKARNDGDKINLIATQVLKGQPAEFKNDFRNQSVGVSMIDKAIAEIDSGVKTGVINNSIQYAYNLAGKDFDPKLAKINGYIVSAIQPYRNSVTGAAWGDQEENEYQQLFGSTKYSPTELRQRLVQTKELLKTKSAEGLNSFVNPLGSYDNVFTTQGQTPSTGKDSKLNDPFGLF